MNTATKLGLVLGGYLLACLAAAALVSIYQRLTLDPAQASAGMAAFGDLVLFVGLFGVLALVPTGLGVFFLVQALRHR